MALIEEPFTSKAAEQGAGEATRPTRRRVLVAAGIGNFIEWYDFVVYGFVATVLAPLFFPSVDPTASLLATFAVFGVGFGMRPLGGLVFGHLGDRYGRRNTLVLVIALMAVGTLLLGLAPTYAQAGVIGPVLLVSARALQGFSVGGEFANSSTFMIEYAPRGERGRYGGWQMFSQMAGVTAGAVVAGILTLLLDPAVLSSWGWRVAFLMSAPLIGVALYVRLKLHDTPVFREVESAGSTEKAPLITGLRQGWRRILVAVGIVCLPGVALYAMFVSMPSYLATTQKVPLGLGLMTTIIGLVVFTAAIPPLAALCDRVGRRPLLLGGAAATTILAYPLYLLIGAGSPIAIATAQVVAGLALAVIHAPVPAALVEAFPTKVRVSSVAIAYGLATAAFSGTAPYLSTWLLSVTKNPFSPAFLVIAAGVVTLAAIAVLPETLRDELDS